MHALSVRHLSDPGSDGVQTSVSVQFCTHVTVASEAYHDWSGEAAGARLRVNFTLKLLLSQNFCNQPLMRFISFASNIGPAAAVPAGPASAPLRELFTCSWAVERCSNMVFISNHW